MTNSTRRARIEAEKNAHRSRRRHSVTLSLVGMATIAGATVAGVAPASANMPESQSAATASSTSTSTGDATTTQSASSTLEIQRVSHSTNSANGEAAQFATAKASDPGTYYQWGGNGSKGYDCSGLTQQAYQAAGVDIPRNSTAQYTGASEHVSMDNLQVGDLVFWSNNGSASGIYHVAIYIGDGQIAHARNAQTGVTVTAVDYSTHGMLDTGARY